MSLAPSEILKGVQFLLSKWESNELPPDTVLALIEVHLEREKELAPVSTKGQVHKDYQYWSKALPELVDELDEEDPGRNRNEYFRTGINFMIEIAGKYISLLE